MTYCTICHKPIKELGKTICSTCYDKQSITKGWKFEYKPKKESKGK